MKFLDKYVKKRLKEIDEHPETNKDSGSVFDEDFHFYMIFIFICILILFFFLGVRFYQVGAPV